MTELTYATALDLAQEADSDGEWDEALRLYEHALTSAGRGEQSQLLRKIGRVHFERGDYDRATRTFEASLMAAQAEKQRKESAAALNALAACAQSRGRMEVAESLYSRASALAQEAGETRLCALIDQNLGTLANTRGDLATALMRYQSALDRFRALDDTGACAWVLNNMGMLHVDVGEWGAAELAFDAAYEIVEQLRDPATAAKIDTNRAELYLKRQNFERAREACDRAFTVFSRLGSDSGLGEVYKFYGILYGQTGKQKMALVQLSLALKLARTCDHPLLEAETESERARILLAQREYRQALRALNKALEIFTALDVRGEILDLERRLDRMGDSYLRAAEIWVDDTAAHRAQGTGSRARRVADYAMALAEEIRFNPRMWLRLGAFLRDIGNAALPADIFRKPGPLDSAEIAAVRQHTIIGEQILEELDFHDEVRSIVRHHHERWDGTGYPDGLRGEEIPLSARIVCIADVYEALISERSYRKAYAPEQALTIMQGECGKLIDPTLFARFRDAMSRSPHNVQTFR